MRKCLKHPKIVLTSTGKCRTCVQRAATAKWQIVNRDRWLDIQRKGRRRRLIERKQTVMQHYGNCRCKKCGIADMDVLTIDHKDEAHGRAERKRLSTGFKASVGLYTNGGSANLYRYLIENDFPQGYQVLCFNCNIKKCARYYGWSLNK